MKKIVFITGTRADYSKIRPLILSLKELENVDVGIFVTGMHMLRDYGSTHNEVESTSTWDYKFINQSQGDSDYKIMSNTIAGFGDFVRENKPDLIVVHGDRIEALAGALVGAMDNVRVAHIEGGELSGSVDDSYRHAITKLSHIHLVSNAEAKARLIQLGESEESIFQIGSPEFDLMYSSNLPSIEDVLDRYEIPFQNYAIAILHPVKTETDANQENAKIFCEALVQTNLNYIIIESNNDQGSYEVREEIRKLWKFSNFSIFPSIRYDFFLILLRNAQFIIGNSSSGVREAPHYGIPAVNLGSRQEGRVRSKLVINSLFDKKLVIKSVHTALDLPRVPEYNFGDGQSAKRFKELIASQKIWQLPIQKTFVERRDS